MNKLYTFGCSVTENLDNLPEWSPRIKYANEYCGGRYNSWPEILGEKLKMKTQNYAALSAGDKLPFLLGNTNEDILEALSIASLGFKKDDIVIVQFTTLGRFRLAKQNNMFDTILPGHISDYKNQSSLIDALENKSNPMFIRPLINSMNPFIRLSEEIGFQFWMWSNDDSIQDYMIPTNNQRWLFYENINELLPKINAQPIAVVTDKKIEDYHLAQPGQEILANLIYNRINE